MPRRQSDPPHAGGSGYGADGIGEEFSASPVLAKPFRQRDLQAALAPLLAPPARDAPGTA